MNGKVNQVLSQQRGFVDLEFFLKSRSRFVADIADCIKSFFLLALDLLQNLSDFSQLARFELFNGLAENQTPAQFFKINNRFLVHDNSITYRRQIETEESKKIALGVVENDRDLTSSRLSVYTVCR